PKVIGLDGLFLDVVAITLELHFSRTAARGIIVEHPANRLRSSLRSARPTFSRIATGAKGPGAKSGLDREPVRRERRGAGRLLPASVARTAAEPRANARVPALRHGTQRVRHRRHTCRPGSRRSS